MRISKRTHHIILFFLIIILIFMVYGLKKESYAATDGMKIHSIYLKSTAGYSNINPSPNGPMRGNPVLLESNGEYLLIDTGYSRTAGDLISYLKSKKVNKLDISVSHMHDYAYQAMENIIDDPYFTVENVYIPNQSMTEMVAVANYNHDRIAEIIALHPDVKLTYLDKDSSNLQYGNATIDIIGPVGSHELPDKTTDNYRRRLGAFVNNYSLTFKITCAGKTFITAGDIEREEEEALVEEYGEKFLKADIYQLPHHGLSTSGYKLIDAARATYSFAGNHYYDYWNGDRRKIYGQRVRSNKYGICFLTADEKKHIVFDVTQNKINIYRGGTLLTKWVTVKGTGNGRYWTTDKFYIDPNTGNPKTGIQKIDEKNYYLGIGGCMNKANYSSAGEYKYWKKYGNYYRYFSKSGIMAKGFCTIKKSLYCFDKNGLRYKGKNGGSAVKIGTNNYFVYSNGKIRTITGWKSVGEQKVYIVNEKGKLAKGWKTIKGKKYYFDKKTGYSNKKIKKVGKSFYYFNSEGELKPNYSKTVGVYSISTNSNGKITNVPSVKKPNTVEGIRLSSSKVKVKWKKPKNQNSIEGYEIKISTDKNFKQNVQKKTVKSNKKSLKITTKKKNTTYYVKVRTYIKFGGEKLYSKYSKAVKIKK